MADHIVEISLSKDGGHTNSDWDPKDLGSTGQFGKRVLKTRCGQARDWVVDIRTSSPRKTDLLGGSIKAEISE